ncbi:unnamed protein product [Pleuronectes platessa]|uniref:Uncharacterized protein n=1 Tax=Pleuronectes platessa TaxID=8262 RepID=A0A9N7Y897_PLEPL|nr:unnamed protein product [Pleuronectes platessa]
MRHETRTVNAPLSVGRTVRRLLLSVNKHQQVHQKRAADIEPATRHHLASPELRRGLWHVTYPDRRLCFSARSLLLPGSTRSEPLTWSQHPDDITLRARAEEGAWACDLPRPQALLLGQISASHPAHRLVSVPPRLASQLTPAASS